jgi:hypothetical protein
MEIKVGGVILDLCDKKVPINMGFLLDGCCVMMSSNFRKRTLVNRSYNPWTGIKHYAAPNSQQAT